MIAKKIVAKRLEPWALKKKKKKKSQVWFKLSMFGYFYFIKCWKEKIVSKHNKLGRLNILSK